jgi:hypothetical protein
LGLFLAGSGGMPRLPTLGDAPLDLQVGLDVVGELVGRGTSDLPQACAHPLAQPFDDGLSQQLLGRRTSEGLGACLEHPRDLQVEEAGVGRPAPVAVVMVMVVPSPLVMVVVVMPVAVSVVARTAASIAVTHRTASSARA